MKRFLLIFMAFWVMLLVVGAISAAAQGQTNPLDQYRRAYDEIRMDDAAVAQVLDEAMRAQFGELNRWKALEEKMTLLTQEVNRSLPLLVEAARKSAEEGRERGIIPLELGRPFEGNLNRAKERRTELGNRLNAERARQQKINDEIAKTEQALLQAARAMVGQTMEDFVPDERQLLATGTVVVLGAYFGPVGIVAAGTLAAGVFAFDAMAKLYYNLKGTGDVTKALTQYLEILRQRKKLNETNMEILTRGYREIDEVADVLERTEKAHNALKERISQALQKVHQEASAAKEKAAAQERTEAAAQLAKTRAELARVPTSWVRYQPLDRGVLHILRNALAEIRESGPGGYNRAVLERGLQDFNQAKEKEWESWRRQVSEAHRQIQKREAAIRAACTRWTDECARRYENEVTRAYTHQNASASLDERSWNQEEEIIWAEAAARAAKMNENLRTGFAALSERLNQSRERLMQELEKLQEERRQKAPRPHFAGFPHQIAWLANQARTYRGINSPSPGEVTRQYFDLYSELENLHGSLVAAVKSLEELARKERDLHKQMEAAFDRAWSDYARLVPDNLKSSKDKFVPWGGDPNRINNWSFRLSSNSWSYRQIEVTAFGASGSWPALTMPAELDWFRDFLAQYERDLPEVAKILADDARGQRAERLGESLVEALNEFTFQGDWQREQELAQRRFTQRDRVAAPGVRPEDSDGALYLAAMKTAWEKNKKNLEDLLALFRISSYRLLYTFKNPFTLRPVIEPMAKIPEKIKLYEDFLSRARAGKGDLAIITRFYESFRQAYESRNHSLVMSFIGDDWVAGDGTTLADLHRSLRDSFAVFNSIRYNITGLTITPGSGNRHRVSYRVTITGRIFAGNLRHEEKSEVNEEVEVDKTGRVRIVRTLSGKFWQ
jgi:hypothetical protein